MDTEVWNLHLVYSVHGDESQGIGSHVECNDGKVHVIVILAEMLYRTAGVNLFALYP